LDASVEVLTGIFNNETIRSEKSPHNSFAFNPADAMDNPGDLSIVSYGIFQKQVQEKITELEERRNQNWELEDSSGQIKINWNTNMKFEFNLSEFKYDFEHVKTFTMTDNPAIDPNHPETLPQSISRDSGLDRTYISDVGRNMIHLYQGWEYIGNIRIIAKKYIICTDIFVYILDDVRGRNGISWVIIIDLVGKNSILGVWPPGMRFNAPRYVMTIPHMLGVKLTKHGMDVIVLDSAGMHFFKSNGNKKMTLFENEANKYRGLAYHLESQLVITSEKTMDGVYLRFLDIKSSKNEITKR
jgi:hypothetical protein